jgi:phenylpropionate dioxygenase-like ring-hydroxylating dioxygenase large terminal subunit
MRDSLLRNCWYLALIGNDLKLGQLRPRKILGEPIVVGRRRDGSVFALRDICPHRGIPLSYGTLRGADLECCYHGWCFDTVSGTCTAIPSLTPDQRFRLSAVRVKSYACREVQGNVWVFVPAEDASEAEPLPLPLVPGLGEHATPQIAETMPFPCHQDHAVMGLMDPAHASYVHTSWWWRTRQLGRREVTKRYEPAPFGFRMVRYPLRESARPYRIFGRNVSTEITFQLPGVRIEHIQGDRHTAVALTAITPLDEAGSEVHQCLYWTMPWLGPLKPVARVLTHRFLKQDRDVVVKQEEGLRHDPPMMLIDDSDTQAKWYFRLKRERLDSQREKRPFVNPVEPRTLRWLS